MSRVVSIFFALSAALLLLRGCTEGSPWRESVWKDESFAAEVLDLLLEEVQRWDDLPLNNNNNNNDNFNVNSGQGSSEEALRREWKAEQAQEGMRRILEVYTELTARDALLEEEEEEEEEGGGGEREEEESYHTTLPYTSHTPHTPHTPHTHNSQLSSHSSHVTNDPHTSYTSHTSHTYTSHTSRSSHNIDTSAVVTRRPTLAPTAAPLSNLPLPQWHALEELYFSLNGPHWLWNRTRRGEVEGIPWNFSSYEHNNPCFDVWEGVRCDCLSYTQCVVKILDLRRNNLTGTIPAVVQDLNTLTVLDFANNNLTGSIPSEIYTLSLLQTLDLGQNQMTGPISPQIAQLTRLEILNVSSNFFTGPLPESVYSSLLQLRQVEWSYNTFYGTLSSRIDALQRLERFSAVNCNLTGTIPKTIENLSSSLVLFHLRYNKFTGTIPEGLLYMRRLIFLDLGHNALTGNIPPFGNDTSLAASRLLAVLHVDSNRLTGTIPESLGSLSLLYSLFLYNNSLEGTLPASLGKLTGLSSLNVQLNYLTGTVPETFANLSSIRILSLYDNFFEGNTTALTMNKPTLIALLIGNNFFTGRAPAAPEGSAFRIMTVYSIGYNLFTGEISPRFALSPLLISFGIINNLMSGTIPSFFGNASFINYLNFGNNPLHGTIPPDLVNIESNGLNIGQLLLAECGLSGTLPAFFSRRLARLTQIDVHGNRLTGTVPVGISALRSLVTLNLAGNKFSGDLSFLCLNCPLANVDISSNAFTGSLPTTIFARAPIETFVASQNCFYGSIPNEICAAEKAVSLILEGLSTANACQRRLFPFIPGFDGFATSRSMEGTIPRCLFALPTLLSLHLSGNGLRDSLPKDLVVSETLLELSLSHNIISGPIPAGVLTHPWSYLDLSANKFRGDLDGNMTFSLNSELDLTVNRLSGNVPHAMRHLEDISILDGNIFDCDVHRHQLPKKDPKRDVYSCGSDEINASIYVGLGLFAISTAIAVLVWRCCVVQQESGESGRAAYQSQDSPLNSELALRLKKDLSLAECVEMQAIPLPTQTHTLTPQRGSVRDDCGSDEDDEDCSDEDDHTNPNNNNNKRLPLSFASSSSSFISLSHTPQTSSLFTSSTLSVSERGSNRKNGNTNKNNNENKESEGFCAHTQKSLLLLRETVERAINELSAQDTTHPHKHSQTHTHSPLQTFHEMLARIRRVFASVMFFAVLVMLPSYAALSRLESTHEDSYTWLLSAIMLSGKTSGTVLCVEFCVLIVLCFGFFLRSMLSMYREENAVSESRRRESVKKTMESNKNNTKNNNNDVINASANEGSDRDHTETIVDDKASSSNENHANTSDNDSNSTNNTDVNARIDGNGINNNNDNNNNTKESKDTTNSHSNNGTNNEDDNTTSGSSFPSDLVSSLLIGVFNFVVMACIDVAYVIAVLRESGQVIIIIQVLLSVLKVLWNESLLWKAYPAMKRWTMRTLQPALFEQRTRERERLKENAMRAQAEARPTHAHTRTFSFTQRDSRRHTDSLTESHSDSLTLSDTRARSLTEESVIQTRANRGFSWSSAFTLSFFSDIEEIEDEWEREDDGDVTAPYYSFSRHEVSYLVFTVILNNIIIPCISTAIISSDCYYNAFFAQPPTQETTVYTCGFYATIFRRSKCLVYSEMTEATTFNLPFIYRYQCSAAFVQNFAAVHIFMFVIVGVVQPLLKMLLKVIYDRSQRTSRWLGVIKYLLPRTLRNLQARRPKAEWVFVEKDKLVVKLSAYLCIVLTFGIFFPPLAVIACVSIFSMTYFEEVCIGRLLLLARERGNRWCRAYLERDSRGIVSAWQGIAWLLVPFAALSYAYLLFDTIGDKYGWEGAIGPVLSVALLPWLILLYRQIALRLGLPLLIHSSLGLLVSSSSTSKRDRLESSGQEMIALSAFINPLRSESTNV